MQNNGYLNPGTDLLEDYASGGAKWVVDSGCTSHMTGSRSLVTDLTPNSSNVTVTYGDKNVSQVLGLGKVVVTPDVSLVNVMLVETLGYNLLSVSQLCLLGFSVFFDAHTVILLWSKSLKVAFVGHEEGGLHVVDFSRKTTTAAICLYSKADSGWLWHRRLAHVNMRTLQTLHSKGHILRLKDVSFCKDGVCRACIEGKMHEVPHPAKTIVSSKDRKSVV